jgi:acetylornithine aminotransferase
MKDIFSYGDHGSTFGGNILSTSAALTVLDELEKIKKSGELASKIDDFQTKIDQLIKSKPALFEKKQGLGLMMGLKMADDNAVAKAVDTAFANGVLVIKAGNSALRFLPAINIPSTDISEGFDRLQIAYD